MKQLSKCIGLFVFFIGTTPLLSGCIGAAMSSAQAVYGRHSLQNSLNDQVINIKVNRAIYWYSKHLKHNHISVNTFNGIVLLTGEVLTPSEQKELTQTIKSIPGIITLHNLTTVACPSSAITRMSDSWITTKLQTQFIAQNELDPSQIKVVTENGRVFLLGIVTPIQSDIAIDIARRTAGVQSVMQMFSYMHISSHK